MSFDFIVLAKRTERVSEDDFERQTLCLRIFPETTVKEIDDWAIKNSIDINCGFTIRKVESVKNPYWHLKDH